MQRLRCAYRNIWCGHDESREKMARETKTNNAYIIITDKTYKAMEPS